LLVGLLLGDIAVGAQNASLVLQIPQQMGEIVTAVLLLTVVSFLTLRRYRIVFRAERRPFRSSLRQRRPAGRRRSVTAVRPAEPDRSAGGGLRRSLCPPHPPPELPGFTLGRRA
jgi:hypothetical protein